MARRRRGRVSSNGDDDEDDAYAGDTNLSHPPSPGRRRLKPTEPEPESSDAGLFSATDTDTDGAAGVRAGNDPGAAGASLLKDQDPSAKWAGWWRRVRWSFILVIGFNMLLFLGQQAALVAVVVVGQAKIYQELVGLAIRHNLERQLPGFNTFYSYWFFMGAFYLYGSTLMPHLMHHDVGWVVRWIMEKHTLISFLLYMGGFVAFVISLKKRKLYRYQFSQLAYCHMAVLVVVGQSTLLAANVFEGLIWFFLPCSLVVCNDCFAYICGFFFGKTPLIRLSPKKTWEGFLGAFVVTVLYGFFATRHLQRWPFMVCPRQGFTLTAYDQILSMDASCGTDLPLQRLYEVHPLSSFVPSVVASALPSAVADTTLSSMQLHAVVMATFASLVAPFGGFFASGFKRAFKIKDFANTIPGHGGFTDRLDCQIIMGGFSYVYMHQLLMPAAAPLAALLARTSHLSPEDQRVLYEHLGSSLGLTAGS